MKRILILEDDSQLRNSMAREFKDRDYEVVERDHVDDLETLSVDFAVIDLRIGSENGLGALTTVLKCNPSCRAVMLTGYASVATAVEAIKRGAINYLTKPAGVDMIEKAFLNELKDSEVTVEMLPLSRQEHEYIEFVLTQNNGNISRTAKVLGLHRSSLQRKMKKLP